MKVLMTTDTLGGVWTYCMDLCAALTPHGVSVALATMGRKLSVEQHRQIDSLPNVQLYESDYRLCWMQDPWDDVELAGEWLLSLEREIEPDVIHLNDLAHGNLLWQAPVILVGHSCVFSWWEAVKGQPAPLEQWRRYQSLVQASLVNAELVVAPTYAMLSALLRHYGPAKASQVISNGRDFPALAPPVKDEREPIIFAAGRLWDDAKNISALAEIAESLPWPVYVAGESKDPNGGEKNSPGMHHLGFLDQEHLAQWLHKAAIYVAPAHYEPFGLSILEAARAGCALVLGNIASLREVWGDAAAYADPKKPAHLHQVITSLINDTDRRQSLSARARACAQHYSSAQMAAEYLRHYRELRGSDSYYLPPTLSASASFQVRL